MGTHVVQLFIQRAGHYLPKVIRERWGQLKGNWWRMKEYLSTCHIKSLQSIEGPVRMELIKREWTFLRKRESGHAQEEG